MQANKKVILFLALSALILLLAGCPGLQEPVEIILKPLSPKEPPPAETAKRFQQSASKGPTAVESAIELSKKCVSLSEQLTVLQQQNHNITAENTRLKDHLATLEPELTQTKKNLKDAENLMLEMHIELNNWKTDILGHRDEIRQANKAQLEALYKILVILGGEVKTKSSQDQALPEESANKPSRPKSQQTQTSGQTNE